MFRRRFSLVISALALTTAIPLRAVLAQEPYGKYMKPPTPVTGEPPWKYVSDPRTDANKIRAAHLYVAAYDEIELARADLRAANAAKASQRFVHARDSLRKAAGLDATCADCWSLLGYACQQTGDRDGAYESYAKCLALNPNHYATHGYRAESYLVDGRIRDALAELDWLKAHGNITTLETNNLTAAIERWTKENPDSTGKP